MKKTYQKPTLIRRDELVQVVATGPNGGGILSPAIDR
jgi:hypothetical protein